MSRSVAFITIILLCAVGCEASETPATVSLSWGFADGRGCDLAGVVTVALRGAGAREVFSQCRAGLAPEGAVDVVVDELPAEFELRELSIDGALLYRGRQPVENSGPVTVSLRFVGGEGS